ncbi:MAG: hypothetical protein IEMM0002_0958 [bacterium]|nr:MAG: hypothetical protein IEMM0002_0958 [bacterium]
MIKLKPEDKPIAIALISLSILFLTLAVATSLTKQPWWGEVWAADPAIGFLNEGYEGISIVEVIQPDIHQIPEESRALHLKELSRHTYRNPPLHHIVKAGWFMAFGTTMFSMRAFSTAWGLVALLSWFVIVSALSESRKTALLAVALISIDYFFIHSAADGRVDMMSVALGSAGLAAYLTLRERDITKALFISHTFVMLSGLTHPNGLLPFAALMLFIFYFDRKEIKPRHVFISIAPYLIGALGWGLYIFKFTESFIYQYTILKSRLPGSFLEAFQQEIYRYLGSYGFELSYGAKGTAAILAKIKLLILAGYIIGVFGLILVPGIRQNKKQLSLFYVVVIYFILMSLFVGNRRYYYLVYITPLFSACLAIFIAWLWTNRLMPRRVLGLFLCGFVLLQLGGDIRRIILDEYHKVYLPMAIKVEQISDKEDVIMSASELAYRIGFDRVIDDSRLGYFTGKRPDIVVVDARYKTNYERYKLEEPETYKFVTDTLKNEFEQVFKNYRYEVYRRSDGGGRE